MLRFKTVNSKKKKNKKRVYRETFITFFFIFESELVLFHFQGLNTSNVHKIVLSLTTHLMLFNIYHITVGKEPQN